MDTQKSYEITGETQFGGFWLRVIAVLVDLVLITVSMTIILVIVDITPVIESIIIIIVWWIYFAGMHSSSLQASVGKKILDMKVTDKNGNRLSFGRATVRHFATYISALIFGIGYIMVGLTKKKRGLHDMIAGTLVIKDTIK